MQKTNPQLFALENTLGPLESEVMKVIWDKDRVTVRDVLIKFTDERSVAYTTIMTVMDHLYQKGFLARKKIKKTYLYFPVIKKTHAIETSLSQIFIDLTSNYGKNKVLYFALKSCILPQIHFSVSTYKLSVGYGIVFTLLLAILGFSLFDLLQNLSFFGATDYLGLLLSDSNLLIDKLHLVFYAFVESLPVINILTTVISLVLVILLFRKLPKFLKYKITLFNSGGGAIS